MGVRCLREPAEEREVISFIESEHAHLPFAQKATKVNVVVPDTYFY